ncbi:MAG: PAS domain-containing protein [Gemmatimonadetes bacterium]|nr:PAS domain-containing protein [Gemmatimonadota bacterium]
MPPAPSPSDEVSPPARSAYDAALQDREERLALALAAARLGTWEWRAADDVSTWSPRCCAIFGLDHFSGSLAEFTAMIHPDDRERADIGFAEAARGSGTATVEHRIVRPDGSVRWVATLCHCRFGPGRPARRYHGDGGGHHRAA